MGRLGAVIDLKARVGELPLAHRQLVEIARALCSGGRVLVLDEPTSALSKPEARGLFDAIRAIAAQDAAVIFVSHRLDEVFEITDALTVLRDGRVVGNWRTADADIADDHSRHGRPTRRRASAVGCERSGSAQSLSGSRVLRQACRSLICRCTPAKWSASRG